MKVMFNENKHFKYIAYFLLHRNDFICFIHKGTFNKTCLQVILKTFKSHFCSCNNCHGL